ncbi:hypothetical protein HA49_12665 [Tatumella morbirosei]|uniref:Uncharacterized protein n=1 Tax=Tatumella morbirosei TaxID=642227 RepID=A0A095T973_9GAMM|nr:hypothetical protein HA49_12665 [Tatumella morbirosei]
MSIILLVLHLVKLILRMEVQATGEYILVGLDGLTLLIKKGDISILITMTGRKNRNTESL